MGYYDGENKIATILESISTLPRTGKSREEIEEMLDRLNETDANYDEGHAVLYTFTLPWHELSQISQMAYIKYMKKNALLDDLFPSIKKMEDDIKSICANLLHGDRNTRVNLTSGGSESIYSALHAARQWAREHHPEITDPEIVVPYSIHAAFSKWCRYTGLSIKRVPLGPDYRADVDAMEKAITPNTILIGGSAPCWSYGLFDPIDRLAELAEKHSLWMHSDCCLGGYLSPFVERLGHRLPPYDFRVEGVHSISADLHKFGWAAKPLSTVLYRDEELQKYHYCNVDDWPSGMYHSEAIMGSRSAGPIASAWAVMNYLGEEGYLKLAQHLMENRKRYIDGINSIDELKCWDNDLCIIVFETGKLDTFSLLGGMYERKAYVFPIMEPPLIQICPDPVGIAQIDYFINKLRDAVSDLKKK